MGILALGVCAGIYYNPATTLIASTFDKTGWAIGTHRIGGQAAGIVAPIIAIVTVEFGWRSVLLMGCLLTGLMFVLFIRKASLPYTNHSSAALRNQADVATLLAILIRPHVRYTTFMASLLEFVGLAVMAFLPTILIEHMWVTRDLANALFAVFFLVALIAQPLGRWLSDRIGRDSTIVLQVAAGLLGYSILATGFGFIFGLVAVILAGIAMSSMPVIQSRMLDGLSSHERGFGFGLFRTLYLLVGSVGTGVIGILADSGGWGVAIGLLAGLHAVVLALL